MLPCFQQLARKPHQYWRFLRSRPFQLFQPSRINSSRFERFHTAGSTSTRALWRRNFRDHRLRMILWISEHKMKVMVPFRSSFLLPSNQHGLNGELLIFDRSYTTTLGKVRWCLFRGQFGNGTACRRCRRHSRTARVCQSFDAPPFCSAVCTARASTRFWLMWRFLLCGCHLRKQHQWNKYEQDRKPAVHISSHSGIKIAHFPKNTW